MKTMKMFMMAMMMTIATSAAASTTTKPRTDRDRHNDCICLIDRHAPVLKDMNYCPQCGRDLRRPHNPDPMPQKPPQHKKQPAPKPAPKSFGNQQSRAFGGHR